MKKIICGIALFSVLRGVFGKKSLLRKNMMIFTQ